MLFLSSYLNLKSSGLLYRFLSQAIASAESAVSYEVPLMNKTVLNPATFERLTSFCPLFFQNLHQSAK